MRLVVQRVTHARVTVEDEVVGEIGNGILVLAGFGSEDAPELPEAKVWKTMLTKMLGLRIFPDKNDKMNLSLTEFGGECLLVSQFTLYADCRRGRRPSFSNACSPVIAEGLFKRLVLDTKNMLQANVKTGKFGAMMQVDLCNWGPVTIILDSRDFT